MNGKILEHGRSCLQAIKPGLTNIWVKMSVYKGRYVFNKGESWVVEATIRSFPDYEKLPDYHYLPLSATSIDGREPDDFQPRAQMKRMFHQNKLNPGEGGTIAEFSRNCIVPLKFVKDYVDHLAQIEMRKEKRRTESERQQMQWMEQDNNDIE